MGVAKGNVEPWSHLNSENKVFFIPRKKEKRKKKWKKIDENVSYKPCSILLKNLRKQNNMI